MTETIRASEEVALAELLRRFMPQLKRLAVVPVPGMAPDSHEGVLIDLVQEYERITRLRIVGDSVEPLGLLDDLAERMADILAERLIAENLEALRAAAIATLADKKQE